jgi:peptidoglycan-associated lipoprotein
MSARIALRVAVLIVFSGLLCYAQQNVRQTTQQTGTDVAGSAGHDEAGRPIQPVGTTTAAPLPQMNPDQRHAFSANVKDVYFDLGKADLRPDARAVLQRNAEWLKAHPDVVFTIEGDADERGGIVYNVFLSDQRALETRDALVKLGIPESQILFATGWGKLYPVCTESNESCWTQNRRSHLSPWPPEDLSERAQAANAAASSRTADEVWQARAASAALSSRAISK